MKKMKKFVCALLVVLTAVTMLSGPFQVPVQAAKTVTANKNPKKAPNIKKKGTYNVNSKTSMKKDDYIRFTAPKSGRYTFTFYNFRDWKKSSSVSRNLGLVRLKKMDRWGLNTQKVKTNGGKTYSLNMSSKIWYDKFSKGKKVTPYLDLYKRYAKINLKKGETVYINTFWTGGKHQYNVKIK